jgi:hypothetical protein
VELSVPEPDQPWPSPSADFPPLVVTAAPEGPAIVCRYPATAPAVLTYHLAHIATPVVWPPLHPAMTQWEAQYQLTAASMARAAAWGYTPAQIIALLGQFSGGEIPPTALTHLRTWQRTTTTCTAESGYYLGMPLGTLKALHPRKAFRQRVRLVGGTQRLDRFTPQGAWVTQAQIDTLIIEHLEFIIEDLTTYHFHK